MKQSIGTVWITGLVITFMLIFSGYLAVTISYSSAIKEKNYVLSIIEKKNGITIKKGSAVKTSLTSVRSRDTIVYNGFGSLETINLFLRGSSYKQKGPCGEGVGDASGRGAVQWYGVKNLYKDNNPVSTGGQTATVKVDYERVKKNTYYYYCFAKFVVDESRNNRSSIPTPAYYRIRMFYALQLPIVDSLVFTVDGKTNVIERPSTCEIPDYRKNWNCRG